jgi:hypothetical protein
MGCKEEPDDGDTTGATPSTIAELETWLAAQPANTAAAPYTVTLKVDSLGGSFDTKGSLGYVLRTNGNKYVNLDLSGSSITGIGERAFSHCSSLAAITIPNSVTEIGNDAFFWCRSLANVTIPDSVTGIGHFAFYGCTSLASVTIGDSVASIGYWAFSACTSLAAITIGDSVASIEGYAFSGCYNLASVTIGNNVANIVIDFINDYSGSSLSAIEVADSNAKYSSLDGVLYDKTKTELIKYPAGKAGASFTIPNSVTSIEGYAFYGCTSLASVTIPNSVTSIGEGAFADCESLASVTFEGTITSGSFDKRAFGYGGYGYIGDLSNKFYATDPDNGTPGTYTRTLPNGTVWTKQP